MTVNVTSATPGNYANTIAASALTTANAGSNATAGNASLSVLSSAHGDQGVRAGLDRHGRCERAHHHAHQSERHRRATGAAFTDTYPAGLVNTGAASGATTCAGGTVTAANNGTSVALSGGTVPANGSCTVTVNVTSAAAGSYLNNTGSITTTNAGTVAGASATLTVLAHADDRQGVRAEPGRDRRAPRS